MRRASPPRLETTLMPPPFRPKGDLAAVGREGGFRIVGGVGSQPDRLTAGHLLYPNIEIAVSAAVGGVGHEPAVGRQGRIGGESGIRGDACQERSTPGLFRFEPPGQPRRRTCQEQSENPSDETACPGRAARERRRREGGFDGEIGVLERESLRISS